MRLDIGMIGDEESLLGFRLLGLRTRACQDSEDAKNALVELSDCGLIFLTDEVYGLLGEEAEEMEKQGHPVLVPLPSQKAESRGAARIRRNIEKAVGADIIGD